MTSDLKILADNREALLLADVAAWLHMIGKYHEDFVNGDNSMDTEIPADLTRDFPTLDKLLKDDWPSKFWNKLPITELNAQKLTIYDLIRYHRDRNNSQSGFLKLFFDAHGRGSGTEKGVLKKTAYDKHTNQVYLAKAFGYEPTPIDTKSLKERKKQLYQFLYDQLKDLKSLLDSNAALNPDEWNKWRQPFINQLQEDFSTSVGDTRLPINDVSLLDQISATVAFFKTELAEVILNGWKDPLDESNKFKYRIICVSFDATGFIAQSPRIGDILARIQIIKRAFDEVKKLIEVDYPLGLEIYRDTNRVAFLAPDVNKLLEIQDSKNSSEKTLRQLIEERCNNILKGEVDINVSLHSPGSRNVFFIGNELSKPLKPLSPKLSFLEKSWGIKADKCLICQIRPQGYGAELIKEYENRVSDYTQKALERKMCCICMSRLQGRAKDWTNNLNKTIWIDEVADINGRIALIVGKFDLKHWLNGEMTSTFRNPKDNCKVEFSEIAQEFAKNQNGKLNNLSKYKEIGETYAKTIQGLYNLLIQDEDLSEDVYSSIPKAEKIALAVWRKTPSFARIRRVWESTKKFWMEIDQKFGGTADPVSKRLKLIGDFESKNGNGLSDYNAYEAELEGVRFSIFNSKNKGLLVIENLQWLAKKMGTTQKDLETYESSIEFVQRKLTGKALRIYDPEDKNREKPIGSLKGLQIDFESTPYTPAISILSEPSTFMAIVPANKAMEVAKGIKEKYEKEMGKVRNRLPLTIGMVFAKSHTPLVALMDAGRRMLKIPTEEEDWVLNDDTKGCDNNCILNFNDGITWKVPVKMGDGTTDDVWYPYFYVNGVPAGRSRAFKGPKGWLVHVTELKKGDKVKVTPSRFDFEFLDTSSRRFEVSYENGKRRGPTKRERPFLLEELDDFKELWDVFWKGLSRSQIKSLIELIETKREEWLPEKRNSVFKRFVYDVLHNANWKNEKPERGKLEKLEKAAVSGKLRDIVELYMNILKEEIKNKKEGYE